MRTILRGIEADTLELDGTLPADVARGLVPAPLVLDDGPVRVNVLWFAMHALHVELVPWPRFDYHEALWRIAVAIGGEPAWLAVACDLDRALIRGFGRWIVRYPTRTASFGERWSVTTDGATLAATARDHDAPEPAAVPARRTFVRAGHAVYEIPWHETAAPVRRRARVAIALDTLSQPTFGAPVAWSPDALVHRGRTHRCGIARRI